MPLLFSVSPSGGTLKDLLTVTSYAILEVFIISSVGYYLGKRGTVDSKTKRTLNKVGRVDR